MRVVHCKVGQAAVAVSTIQTSANDANANTVLPGTQLIKKRERLRSKTFTNMHTIYTHSLYDNEHHRIWCVEREQRQPHPYILTDFVNTLFFENKKFQSQFLKTSKYSITSINITKARMNSSIFLTNTRNRSSNSKNKSLSLFGFTWQTVISVADQPAKNDGQSTSTHSCRCALV